MTTKSIAVLGGLAIVLGAAAYLTASTSRVRTPQLSGRRIVEKFDLADVASVEAGGGLKLTAAEKGWTVDSKYGYPASVEKIRENLLKLDALKVGQVIRSRKLGATVKTELKNAAGEVIASAELGDRHYRKARGEMAQFGGGGYADGRYMNYAGQTVLVNDALDEFDGDFKKWIDTRICEVPSADVVEVTYASAGEKVELKRAGSGWKLEGLGEKEELDSSKTYSLGGGLSYLDLADVADPALDGAKLGFATGGVYTVTLKDGVRYTANLGAAADDGRYFKVAAQFSPTGTNAVENAALEKKVAEFNATVAKWNYVISAYSADSMMKKRSDLVKAKEEPKKDDSAEKSEKVQ
jgi:hypothetical protein